MWELIGAFALKFLGMWLDRQKDKKEATEAFLKFVDSLRATSLSSVKLSDSYEAQLEELKKKWTS